MNWNDITVQQYQQLVELWQGKDDAEAEAFDVMADTCGICHNLTPHQVDSLTVDGFKKLCAELDFLNAIPEWKPAKDVTVNGRRYRFVYDVRQIHAARNMEVKQFGEDGLIPNLHKVAASMVTPQQRPYRKGTIGSMFFGRRWQDAPYDAAMHEQYAEDIRQAPITAIYGSALFFCEVFRKLIEATRGYLTSTIPKEKRKEAMSLLQDSCTFLDGSTMQPGLPSTSASPLTRRIPYHTSSS